MSLNQTKPFYNYPPCTDLSTLQNNALLLVHDPVLGDVNVPASAILHVEQGIQGIPGPGTSGYALVSSYASLTAAATAIGPSQNVELLLDVPTTCTANTVVTSNISVKCTKKGQINQGAYSLTFNGTFSAGLFQVFTGTGLVRMDVMSNIFPQWWGAKLDGSDDTVPVQMAVNCASRANSTTGGLRNNYMTISGSGVVVITGALTASQISLPSRGHLKGLGWQTSELIQTNGANCHFIVVASSADTERVRIEGLYINGNKANQVGTWDGINLDNTASLWDRRHIIDSVYISNCSGNGLSLRGPWGASEVTRVITAYNGVYGIYSEIPDSWFFGGDHWFNGSDGVHNAGGSNCTYSSMKSWCNGTNGVGTGFFLYGNRLTYTALSAQDNQNNGFDLRGTLHNGSSLLADRNGKYRLTSGSFAAAGFAIVALTNSTLNLVATDFGSSLSQAYGVQFSGGGISGNDITLMSSGNILADYQGYITSCVRFVVNGVTLIAPPITSSGFITSAIPATSTANAPCAFAQYQVNTWNGAASQSGNWNVGPLVPASGVPGYFKFRVVPTAYPSGLAPIFELGELGTANSSSGNYSSTVLSFAGTYWDGSTTHYPAWQMQATLGAGTTPTNTLNIISSSTGGVTGVNINSKPVGTKVSVPVTSGDAGLPGQFAAGGGYIYVYTGDGTTHAWLRSVAASW